MSVAAENFWSRRCAAVQAEAEAARAAQDAAQTQAALDAQLAAQAEKSDVELLDELGLPDPGSLSLGDDFTAFMRRDVPERLRRVALRQLWRSNPVLANLDGLIDHGEDYTDAAVASGGVKTAYQVGKGMLAHLNAVAKAAEEVLSDAVIDEQPELVDNLAFDAPHDTLPAPEIATAPDDDTAAMRKPSHMKFVFDQQEYAP